MYLCQLFIFLLIILFILDDIFFLCYTCFINELEKREFMQEKNFATQIKVLRKSLGMNQKEFAAKLGIRQSTLSSYENEAISPSTDMLITIAKEFNVSVDWLCGLTESKTTISTLSDIIEFLFEMEKISELHFDINIDKNEDHTIITGITFDSRDEEHKMNIDMCMFLSAYAEHRESFESYFVGKDMYELWQKNQIEYYDKLPLTRKEFDDFDSATRTKLRNELLRNKLHE